MTLGLKSGVKQKISVIVVIVKSVLLYNNNSNGIPLPAFTRSLFIPDSEKKKKMYDWL